MPGSGAADVEATENLRPVVDVAAIAIPDGEVECVACTKALGEIERRNIASTVDINVSRKHGCACALPPAPKRGAYLQASDRS